ncbi:hypothetical protein O3M35_003145 [Rhynocoris fuscipes]|uniref:Uncharacterized protein n=1 Tax=Rhynocoris fuscipes TaxID=488301 RepID=A0AAW1CQK9_9HEMI
MEKPPTQGNDDLIYVEAGWKGSSGVIAAPGTGGSVAGPLLGVGRYTPSPPLPCAAGSHESSSSTSSE